MSPQSTSEVKIGLACEPRPFNKDGVAELPQGETLGGLGTAGSRGADHLKIRAGYSWQ